MKWWLWGLLAALGVAVLLSPLASRWPDGLERVAERGGFLQEAIGKKVMRAPISDYAFPGLGEGNVARAVAGLVGTLLAFGLAFGTGKALARRKRKEIAGDGDSRT